MVVESRQDKAAFGQGSGLVDQRARFHLAYRLAVRHQLARAASKGGRSRRWVGVATTASILGDVATWSWLRRSNRLELGPRLAIDSLDAAAWTSAGSGTYDVATLIALPLAVEAGLRRARLGWIVPGAVVAATSGARLGRHLPVGVGTFRWPVIGWLAGGALDRAQQAHRRAVLRRVQVEQAAKEGQAEVAGENHEAVGSDSVADLLARTLPLLRQCGRRPTTATDLASWKASLAERTQHRAGYAGVTLAAWQCQHNRHPDLSTLVDLRLGDRVGTLVISPGQAEALIEGLDRLSPVGTVGVELADDGAVPRPGQRCLFMVDGNPLDLPADPAWSPPFDPGPLLLALSPVPWLTLPATRGAEHCPALAVVPASVLSLIVAAWSQRHLVRHGDDGRAGVLWASLVPAVANAVSATTAMRRAFNDEGMQHFPVLLGLNPVAMLAAFYLDDLSGKQRRTLSVAVLGVLGLGLALLPERVHVGDFLGEAKWQLAAFLAVKGSLASLERDAVALGDEWEHRSETVLAKAFERGRHRVLDHLDATCREAWDHLEERAAGLSGEVRVEVRQRLEDATRRLADRRSAAAGGDVRGNGPQSSSPSPR